MRPAAVEALCFHASETPGNPSGSHWASRAARQVIDEARDVMAELLGCRPGEISFTSGGTEANNLALFGVASHTGGVVAASAIEHVAVVEPTKALGGYLLNVDHLGQLDLEALENTLNEAEAAGHPIRVVAAMLVNNEIGAINDLGAIATVLEGHGVYLHTDAVQAPNWVDVATAAAPAHLIAVSGHKFGGPKGVGALAIREGTPLQAMMLGGGQERERRSGTQNVAGIAAMAAAAKATLTEQSSLVNNVQNLRDRLAIGIHHQLEGVHETQVAKRAAGFCHLCFEGVESEPLLFLLDQKGVAASAASSCASGALQASHVLEAIGVAPGLAKGSLRLSLGYTTTQADVDYAIEAVVDTVQQLRGKTGQNL